ncbi:MAG: hypothetical protein HY819_24830 [Acidobacteria bacterium]|nr:hypothetical protein [Acidobacteriota bacterium]
MKIMAPMEKSYYLITWRESFFNLLKTNKNPLVIEMDEPQLERLLIAITQGGFGQDVSPDDTIQVKERFLEFACREYDVDFPRTIETFDEYFELVEPDYFLDLDEEL